MLVARHAWTKNSNGMFVADFLLDEVIILCRRGSV